MTITLVALVVLSTATYRISKFFVDDFLFNKIREKIFTKFPPETTYIGYFFTCYWCTSMWIGTLVTLGYILSSTVMLVICLPFAISAIASTISDLR